MTFDDNDIHTLAAPYALDALDDLERRRFEDHLAAGCDTCVEDVAGYLAVAAELGGIEEVPVSDELRSAVAAVPDEVRQVGPALRRRRAGARLRRWSTVAAAVLAVVAIGLGAVAVDQRRDLDAAQRQAAVLAILREPDASLTTVDASTDGGGVVRVVRSDGSGVGAVLATGLPQPGEGRVYQLWLIDEDGASSAGFLEIGDDGRGTQVLDGRVGRVDTVGVSVEPSGGSTAPTTTPIAVLPPA